MNVTKVGRIDAIIHGCVNECKGGFIKGRINLRKCEIIGGWTNGLIIFE
jgi:hypothetical protein